MRLSCRIDTIFSEKIDYWEIICYNNYVSIRVWSCTEHSYQSFHSVS